MLTRIKLHVFERKSFWWLKNQLDRIKFKFDRLSWVATKKAIQSWQDLTTLVGLLRVVYSQLFFVAVSACILVFVGPMFCAFYGLPENASSASDYVSFLAAVSSISGVFIGLYYAAIVSFSSAIYARAPSRVRELIVSERIGIVYMRFLSFVCLLSLTLIALHLSNQGTPYIAVPIVAFLSAIGVVAFVRLGQLAFNLFDPTALARYLFQNFEEWTHLATVNSSKWNDPNFQSHANRMATYQLISIKILSEFTRGDASHLKGRPMLLLATNLFPLLSGYEVSKGKIPSKSKWFELHAHHNAWHQNSDTSVTFALTTGTYIDSNKNPNYDWVEDRLSQVVLSTTRHQLEQHDYSLVAEIPTRITPYLEQLVIQRRTKRALDVAALLGNEIFQAISNNNLDKVALRADEIILTETLAILPISILISHVKSVTAYLPSEISKRVSSIDWRNSKGVYSVGFPAAFIPELENLSTRVRNEFDLVGRKVSPDWYLSEILTLQESSLQATNTRALVFYVSGIYNSWKKKLEGKTKQPWLIATLQSREWEYWNKLLSNWKNIEAGWKEIESSKRIRDLPWPSMNLSALIEQVGKTKYRLLSQMSALILNPNLVDRPKDYPDYSGQFLDIAGQGIFELLETNSQTSIVELFLHYFLGSLALFERLKPSQIVNEASQQQLKIAASTLLDLMSLSGCAKILSEHHGNAQLWSPIQACWDIYLDQSKVSGRSLSTVFAQISQFASVDFELPHRSAIRFHWQQRTEREIYRSKSASKLLRVLNSQVGSFYDSVTVFITMYLVVHRQEVSEDTNYKVRSLVHELSSERDNGQRSRRGRHVH